MKKILLTLGVLAMASIGFADAKSDYEMAVNYAGQGKIKEAVVKLEEVVKSKDKNFSDKASFQLGFYYGQQDDAVNAKKYLAPIWQSTVLSENERIAVLELLYAIGIQEKDFPMLEKYIKELNKLANGENPDYVSSEILLYLMQNKKNEAMNMYNNGMKSKKSNEFKTVLAYNIGAYHLNENKLEEAKKYFDESYKLNTELSIQSGVALYRIALMENNLKEAERILLEINKKTNESNEFIINELGSYYYTVNEYAKAESQFKKLEAKYPNEEQFKTLLLAVYENLGNKNNVKKYYDEVKKLIPDATNEKLGNIYASMGDVELSEKYLKKAINEDKDNEVRIQLVRLYALTGKLNEAKLEAMEAVKLNVSGAKEILKQLEAIK